MSRKILTVIIPCHSEGILLHHTLRSVYRSLSLFDNKDDCEVIVHADAPTQSTKRYLESIRDFFPHVIIHTNAFNDAGESRNFCVRQATGIYVATIDGDDIMSKEWLRAAIDTLERQAGLAVAHSELTIEFEEANSLVLKHGGGDMAKDTLLSVYSNRWNSVIVAKKDLLLKNPYPKSGNGYGYEDWHVNNQLIAAGAKHVLVPNTVIFVRRKLNDSVWRSQIESMYVLRANTLLSFQAVRKLENPFYKYLPMSTAVSSIPVREFIKKHPVLHLPARKTKSLIFNHFIKTRNDRPINLPAWLLDEWKAIHSIDRQIYPTNKTLKTLDVHDSLSKKHKIAGAAYKYAVDSLQYDSYSYMLLVPWLSAGGADKFVINYARSIASSNVNKRVLVVATLNAQSNWKDKLPDNVDFLDFGSITHGAEKDIKYRVMSQLIENGGITHIHVVNSEFGYNYIRDHSAYITANKKVVVTSFSQSVDADHRLYGYSHTHVPFVYDIVNLITTDNSAVAKMWHDEYGFDTKKIRVHKTPLVLNSSTPNKIHKPKSSDGVLRVLWAARLAPEKLAHLLPKIGALLKGTAITIDMYGEPEQNYSTSFLKRLPHNVQYKGGFSGFSSLPLDEYSAFLYTSLFDGMPNVLLEAAEAGLPIVASSVGGIPEFITPSGGILIEDINDPNAYAQALRLLADSPETRLLYSRNAYDNLRASYNKDQYEASVTEMLDVIDY